MTYKPDDFDDNNNNKPYKTAKTADEIKLHQNNKIDVTIEKRINKVNKFVLEKQIKNTKRIK